MFKRKRQLKVQNTEVAIKSINGEDFFSLTDMLKAKEGKFFIWNWLRNRDTLEFLGAWESINNPNFNYIEFDIIRNQSGLNSFQISVKEWVDRTNAIGLQSIAGRYGGTFAHKEIALEFGMWISPIFKLHLIKDYERLKQIESNQYNIEWNVRRLLASTTYAVHTDAIKDVLIPQTLPWKTSYKYASEADIINLALFGMTAKEWRDANPEQAKNGENLRDSASINELTVLDTLQLQSAELIRQKLPPRERLEILKESATAKLSALEKVNPTKTIKRTDDSAFLESGE